VVIALHEKECKIVAMEQKTPVIKIRFSEIEREKDEKSNESCG
jgi:predicted N-acetyltransferase YhbS